MDVSALSDKLAATWLEYGPRAVYALVILIVGWLAVGVVAKGVRRVSERRLPATLAPLLVRVTRVSAWAVVLVAVLDKLGVATSSILAFLGAAGLAVGLALKDTIGDVASGIALVVLRPFDVGNAVDIGGALGVVTAIDLFETKLTSFEGVPTVLPNSKVRGATVHNFSRAEQRRIDLAIGVSYGADLARAIAAIREVVAGDARVLSEPDPVVNVDRLGESSVDLLVRCHCAAADFLVLKMDLTRAVKERLDQEGIEIPFPQRVVHGLASAA